MAVRKKNTAPSGCVDEQSGQQGRQRQSEINRRYIDTDSPPTFARRKNIRYNGHVGCKHHCAPQTLNESCHNQDQTAIAQCTGQGRKCKNHISQYKNPPSAKHIRQTAHRYHKNRGGQQKRHGHPTHPHGIQPEIPVDIRQCKIHRRAHKRIHKGSYQNQTKHQVPGFYRQSGIIHKQKYRCVKVMKPMNSPQFNKQKV